MKELIIGQNKDTDKKYILFVENNEILEKYDYFLDNSIEGNIYVGRVQNVLPGLQSAFINIGEKKNAFIHVKDILQKVDITKEVQIETKPINQLIKPGDPIIVEVKKEAVDKKGPRLSTHLSLTSRFIVFMPNANFITISQKIENETEKERLKNIVKKYLPKGTGAIIRTTAEGCLEETIKKDIQKSIERWKKIQLKKVEKYPQKIYDKGGILRKTLVDLVDNKLDKIVLQDKNDLEKIETILDEIGATTKIEIDNQILEKHTLKKQIESLNSNKIWLKSGAFITIDKTEALVAIDVNSGKYIGNKDVEETILSVNLEAAKEISKQIRLRDISGIIIIDFIDMKKDENKQAVINEIKENSKKDRSRVQVEEFTKLNLMEITRKHINSKK